MDGGARGVYLYFMVGLSVISDHRYTLSRLEQEQDPAQRGITCTGTFRCTCFISKPAEILMSPGSHQHVPCITMRLCAVLHILFRVRAVRDLFIPNKITC